MGGYSTVAWVAMWDASHGPDGARLAWPDGQCLLVQPAIVVRVFALVTEIAVSIAKAKAKQEA